jgi:hypothetical protein
VRLELQGYGQNQRKYFMADSIISFDDFELPFMEDPGEDCDELDRLEAMEDMIPSNATTLGTIDAEVQNWTTWRIEDQQWNIENLMGSAPQVFSHRTTCREHGAQKATGRVCSPREPGMA